MREPDATDGRLHAEFEPRARSLRSMLVRFFRGRLRGAPDVEDLVQDVFLRIVSRNGGGPIGHLGGYVRQTALSVLTDRSRRRTTHAADDHVEIDPEEHGELDFDPDRVMQGREELALVAAALLELPERTRSAFLLFRMEDVSQRDIADRMGITVSGVQKHILKAMRHLRDRRAAER